MPPAPFLHIIDDSNERTQICFAMAGPPWRPTLRELFAKHYAVLSETRRGAPNSGALVVAVHRFQGVTGHVHLEIDAETGCAAAIVGRHARAQLRLDYDPTIALRQLAVLWLPDAGGHIVRLVDLHTGAGMLLEDGSRCDSLATAGPMHVVIGDYAVLVLPVTGKFWRESADEACRALPKEVLLDRRDHEPVSLQGLVSGRRPTEEITSVRILPPLAALDEVVVPPGLATAELAIRTPTGARRFLLDDAMLDRGVLVGRYERCSIGGGTMELDISVSRVHTLVIRCGDRILAIDTASTNGLGVNGRSVTITELHDVSLLELGHAAEAVWRTASGFDIAVERIPLNRYNN